MPAVASPLPGGLDWDELTGLCDPWLQKDALLGIDLTIYNRAAIRDTVSRRASSSCCGCLKAD
jgi:arginase family enzyme